jgi:hypothetical protein
MSEGVVGEKIGGRSEENAERIGIRERATGKCGQKNRPAATREKSAGKSEGQECVGGEIHG